jgi:hypothetical protein
MTSTNDIVAIGYTHASGGLTPNTEKLPWSGTSAGGGYATVHDLFRFAEALQAGKLLNDYITSVLPKMPSAHL